MIEIPITYDTYNDETVTETFHFNMTKLELVETDLDLEGGIEETAKRLTKTENAKEAYYLFKKLLLDSYGHVSADGRRFEKSDDIRKEFEQSPALPELIISFIQDPQKGIEFFNGVFPKSLRDQVQAQKNDNPQKEPDVAQILGATGPADEQDNEVKHFEDFDDNELLAMNDEAFNALLPPRGQMTRRQLNLSQRRKQQG